MNLAPVLSTRLGKATGGKCGIGCGSLQCWLKGSAGDLQLQPILNTHAQFRVERVVRRLKTVSLGSRPVPHWTAPGPRARSVVHEMAYGQKTVEFGLKMTLGIDVWHHRRA